MHRLSSVTDDTYRPSFCQNLQKRPSLRMHVLHRFHQHKRCSMSQMCHAIVFIVSFVHNNFETDRQATQFYKLPLTIIRFNLPDKVEFCSTEFETFSIVEIRWAGFIADSFTKFIHRCHSLFPPRLNLCPKNGLCNLIERCGAVITRVDGGSCITGNRFGGCHVHARDIMSLICATVSAGMISMNAVYAVEVVESVIVVMIQGASQSPGSMTSYLHCKSYTGPISKR